MVAEAGKSAQPRPRQPVDQIQRGGQAARIVDQVAGDEQQIDLLAGQQLDRALDLQALDPVPAGEVHVGEVQDAQPASRYASRVHCHLHPLHLDPQPFDPACVSQMPNAPRRAASVQSVRHVITLTANSHPSSGSSFTEFTSHLPLLPVYGRTCPSPNTTHLYVVSSCKPIGPRAWSFCVLMATSAPRPNWLPSLKRVLALTKTAAESTSLTKR